MTSSILETVDRLKKELDALRPLPPDVVAQVEQKLRIESNYHSNAVEGNSLTLGETRSLILHGLTARGKPMRDHLDIQGHDDAVKAIERAVKEEEGISAVFIRNLHRVLLKEPYETEATTSDGRRTTRHIALGDYKTTPNNVKTSTGEIYYFTPPEQVKPAMTDLLDWYRAREAAGEHPVIIAAAFHYRFVRIHPFDDGNGRMARLLMNLILIKHGYTVAIVQSDDRSNYLNGLEQADKSEDLSQFIGYIASCCTYALDLYVRAAHGEPIEDPIDHEIELFRRYLGRRTAVDERVALRRYVEAVACPFYDYFRSKTAALASGIFTSLRSPSLTIEGTSVDGPVFEKGFHGMGRVDLNVVPEQAIDVVLMFEYTLVGFRNTSTRIHVRVENTIDALDCQWGFHLSGSHSHDLEEYHGRDLDDLRSLFNKLLRHMMGVLKEWSADSA